MTKRIFRSISLAALCVLLLSLILITGVLYEYFSAVARSDLKAQTALAAQGVEADGQAYFDGLDAGDLRITWIGPDGKVLYDTRTDAAGMENHLDRQEVAQALESGYGESSRYSATLLEKLLYSAQRLDDGSVVRLSRTRNSVVTLMLGIAQPVLVIVAAALLLSLALASRLAKRIVEPLNRLDLEAPLENDGYDELSPLLRRLDSQQTEIRRQLSELERRRNEFDAITGSMNEGLVLINDKNVILSINNSAMRLLGTDRACVGRDMLTLDRSPAMRELLEKALGGRRAEALLELGGGEYQLSASPVVSDGAVSGAALLLFDVTERERAEQMRREFTANVSHELKTPLHSISGCAEMLLGDIVRPEDVKRFTGQIYSEAQRMILLVEDIIRLSRLDEGDVGAEPEETDLRALAESALASLQSEADAAGVTLSLTGGATVTGVPQLISGIIFNLCDNAIKYNRPGGSVAVRLENSPEAAVLTVEDTGVGIAPEQQSRVFERFYRVDKSRSKEIGGTGLGLSIVKHSARLLGASIDLQSVPGEGTTVTVRFPKG